jgi:hypothetical protein
VLGAAGFEVRMRLATPVTHDPSRTVAELLLPADQVAQQGDREQVRVDRRLSNA